MLARLKFNIDPLINEMLDQIPQDVLINGTILDPAIGGGQFVKEVERRKRAAGKTNSEIADTVFGIEENTLRRDYAINKHQLSGTYEVADFLTKNFNGVKFDVIIGNPPYQDGKKVGGQNKIYNQFSKKAISLLKTDGKIAFITPSSVLRESKRFSLIDVTGLKLVNFNANNYFTTVGVNICSWIIDKSYKGNVKVISQQGENIVPPNTSIYNPSEFDLEFINIYESLKRVAKTPKDRMFKQNPVDASISGRSKTLTATHTYPVYKIGANGDELVQYNKPIPKLYGKLKFVISTTKAFRDSSCVVSANDFDVNHLFIDVNNQTEVDNIKSFLFSEYFVNHSFNFKRLDGYGFNNSLTYLPTFDKTKNWTNIEVKSFIEGFSK